MTTTCISGPSQARAVPFSRTRGSKINRRMALSACLAMTLAVGSASGDYILTPTVNNQSTWNAPVGTTFTVDVTLSGSGSPGPLLHDSSLFYMVFSAPGLMYEAYSWQLPYSQNPADQELEDCVPSRAQLPALITPQLLSGGLLPVDGVDIQLSNLSFDQPFATGLMARLTFTVPLDYSGPSEIVLVAQPDTFALGFDEVPAISGAPLTITIPATGSVLSLALPFACAVIRRRR